MMQHQISIQIIAGVFAIFALSRAYLRFKEQKLSSFGLLFWLLVWVGGITVVLLPQLTEYIANFLGIGRGVDVIMYVSIVLIFYLIFRIYIKLEDTQKQITQLVRKIALDSARKRTTSK